MKEDRGRIPTPPPARGAAGALTPEPFLIIGLIASIRNVLVITLKSSGVTAEGLASVEGEMLFRSSIVELAVLGVLIFIFVVSVYLLRRGRALRAANAHEADQDRLPEWRNERSPHDTLRVESSVVDALASSSI